MRPEQAKGAPNMLQEIGLDWFDVVRIAGSCVIFYAAVLIMVRFLGARTLASLSSFDLAALIALGSIIGRAILGDAPTLAGGLLGIVTLLLLQALTGQLRRFSRAGSLVNNPAVLLMAGDEYLHDNMRRSHVVGDEIAAKLRQSGIRHPDEVAAVILEPTGQISVLRRGRPIDPALLQGVIGAARMPQHLLAE